MALESYHVKYTARSDEELQRRADVKEEELRRIFEVTKYASTRDPARVAVLGCADKRFVPHHKRVFEKLLKKTVELITFDIATEHLAGEHGVIKHDCTLPLPDPPYDITFGHVLLKFIKTEKQWNVLKNSYNALRSPGLAIHVFDAEDVETASVKQADGLWSMPIERWKTKLTDQAIKFFDLRWEISLEHIPIPIRGLRGGALVLIK